MSSPVRRDDIIRMYSMHFFDADAELQKGALKEIREPSLRRWATISKIAQDMEDSETYPSTADPASFLDHANGIPRIPIPHADGGDNSAVPRYNIDKISQIHTPRADGLLAPNRFPAHAEGIPHIPIPYADGLPMYATPRHPSTHIASQQYNLLADTACTPQNAAPRHHAAETPKLRQHVDQYQQPQYLHQGLHQRQYQEEQQKQQTTQHEDQHQQQEQRQRQQLQQYGTHTKVERLKHSSSAAPIAYSNAPRRSASIPAKILSTYYPPQPATTPSQRSLVCPPRIIYPQMVPIMPHATPHAMVPQSARLPASRTAMFASPVSSRRQRGIEHTLSYQSPTHSTAPLMQHDTFIAAPAAIPAKYSSAHTTKPMMPPCLYEESPPSTGAMRVRSSSPESASQTVRSASPYVLCSSCHSAPSTSRWPNVSRPAHHLRTDAAYSGSTFHNARPITAPTWSTLQSGRVTSPGLNPPTIQTTQAIPARHDLATFQNMRPLSPTPSIFPTPQHALKCSNLSMYQNQGLLLNPYVSKRAPTVASRSDPPSQRMHLPSPAPPVRRQVTSTCADFSKDQSQRRMFSLRNPSINQRYQSTELSTIDIQAVPIHPDLSTFRRIRSTFPAVPPFQTQPPSHSGAGVSICQSARLAFPCHHHTVQRLISVPTNPAPTTCQSSQPMSPPTVQTAQPVTAQLRSAESQIPLPTSPYSSTPSIQNPKTIHSCVDSSTYQSSRPLSPSFQTSKPVSAYPYSPPSEMPRPASPSSSLPDSQNRTVLSCTGSATYQSTRMISPPTFKATGPAFLDSDSAEHQIPPPASLDSTVPDTEDPQTITPAPAPYNYQPQQLLPLVQPTIPHTVLPTSPPVDLSHDQQTTLSRTPTKHAINSEPETARPPTPPKRSMLQSLARGLPMHHASPPATHRANAHAYNSPQAFASPLPSVSAGGVYDTPKFGNGAALYREKVGVGTLMLDATHESIVSCLTRVPDEGGVEKHSMVVSSRMTLPLPREREIKRDTLVKNDQWTQNTPQQAPAPKQKDPVVRVGSLPAPRAHRTGRSSLDSQLKSAVRVAAARRSACWRSGSRNSAPVPRGGKVDVCADMESNSTAGEEPQIKSHGDAVPQYLPNCTTGSATIIAASTVPPHVDHTINNANCVGGASNFLAEHPPRTDNARGVGAAGETPTPETAVLSAKISQLVNVIEERKLGITARDSRLVTPPARSRPDNVDSEEKSTSQNPPPFSCMEPSPHIYNDSPVHDFPTRRDTVSMCSVSSYVAHQDPPCQPSSATSSATSMRCEHPLSTPASSRFPPYDAHSSLFSHHITREVACGTSNSAGTSIHGVRDRGCESFSSTRVVEVQCGSRASSVCDTQSSQSGIGEVKFGRSGEVGMVYSDSFGNSGCVADIERERSEGTGRSLPGGIFDNHDGSNEQLGNVEFLEDAKRPVSEVIYSRHGILRSDAPGIKNKQATWHKGAGRGEPETLHGCDIRNCNISISFNTQIDLETSIECVMHSRRSSLENTVSNTKRDCHTTDAPVRHTNIGSAHDECRASSTIPLIRLGERDEPGARRKSPTTDHTRENIGPRLLTALRVSSSNSSNRSSCTSTDRHHAAYNDDDHKRPSISSLPASDCLRPLTNDSVNAPMVPECHRVSLTEPLSSTNLADERTLSAAPSCSSADQASSRASSGARPYAAAHRRRRSTAKSSNASHSVRSSGPVHLLHGPLLVEDIQSGSLTPSVHNSSACQEDAASSNGSNEVVWHMNSVSPAPCTAWEPVRRYSESVSNAPPPRQSSCSGNGDGTGATNQKDVVGGLRDGRSSTK
eukprot:GEMP01000284.1.p1 GENE.GEMP01000284.1~~GEMP01000284.1.p1  ORF type:complete len:1802 (+),score=314.38 GEMP01000284.1:326-5731(+)